MTYKPDVDDLRNSPALDIVKFLSQRYGERVLVSDPYIHKFENQIGLNLMTSHDAVDKSELTIILVSHKEYQEDFKLKNKLKKNTFMDLCNFL